MTSAVWISIFERSLQCFLDPGFMRPGPKTIKKNTNSTPNKFQTQRARAYEVTSFLSTDCELSTNPCSRFLYRIGWALVSKHPYWLYREN